MAVLNHNVAADDDHDQIRTAVTDVIGPSLLVERHAQLAHTLALEPDVEPQILVMHCREAGDSAAAYNAAVTAATAAEAQLAFDRAALAVHDAKNRGDHGNGGIIRSPIRAMVLPGKDTPSGRAIAFALPSSREIISLPRLGGLHHRYTLAA